MTGLDSLTFVQILQPYLETIKQLASLLSNLLVLDIFFVDLCMHVHKHIYYNIQSMIIAFLIKGRIKFLLGNIIGHTVYIYMTA